MKAFSDAIAIGSLAKLTYLGIGSNQIGDEGIKVFSSAIGSRSLGSLTILHLAGNPIGNEGMKRSRTRSPAGPWRNVGIY